MPWLSIKQKSPEWWQARLGKVTGSTIACVMANYGKPFGNPARKLARKLAKEIVTGVPIIEDGFANAHMTRGVIEEPLAIALYEQQRMDIIEPGGFYDCGIYGASPDGRSLPGGVIEAKSAILSMHQKRLKRTGPDPSYKWQRCLELMAANECEGTEWLDFMSYCSELEGDDRLKVWRINLCDIEEDISKAYIRLGKFKELLDDEVEEVRWR